MDWKQEGCYNERRKRKRMLTRTFKTVKYEGNKEDPDIQKIFDECRAAAKFLAFSKFFQIFGIRVRTTNS